MPTEQESQRREEILSLIFHSGCSCHTNPPCSYCVDLSNLCSDGEGNLNEQEHDIARTQNASELLAYWKSNDDAEGQ